MSDKIYDLAIIGGGCAGLTAAIYAARAKLDTVLIEGLSPGGQAALTEEIVNYPGFEKISGHDLANRMLSQAKAAGTEFMRAKATSVKLTGKVKRITTNRGELQCKSVIIAAGAEHKKAGFDGEERFAGRGVSYCASCDGSFFEGKDIFVIGGGESAAQEALFLTRFAKRVLLIVRKDKLRCSEYAAAKLSENEKVEIRFNTELIKLAGEAFPEAALFKNTKTGDTEEHKSSEGFGVFVFVGSSPATDIYKEELTLDENGYIITDERMNTDISGVFAAGDIRKKRLRQIVTAASDGAIAAYEAEIYLSEQGTLKKESEDTMAEKSYTPSGLISDEAMEQVKTLFERIQNNVTVKLISDPEIDESAQLESLCRDLCSLSDKLHIEVYQKGDDPDLEISVSAGHFPTAALFAGEKYSGIKFTGVPLGYEFDSIMLALYNLGIGDDSLDADIKKRLKAINHDVELVVGVTLGCHFCPETVISAQRLAAACDRITAEMIDVSVFSDVAKEYSIMSVPALIINGRPPVFGAMSLQEILELIEKNS